MEYLGLVWLGILFLNAWGIIAVLGAEATLARKAIWATILLFLPLIGFVAWFLLGPRRSAA